MRNSIVKLKRGVVHPPLSTGRLEGEFHKNSELWAPSISYKQSLRSIKDQPTPAEAYKIALKTTEKIKRILANLEFRWNFDIEKWTRWSTMIKAAYRGMLARREFKKRVKALQAIKRLRDVKNSALECYENGRTLNAIDYLDSLEDAVITEELILWKTKMLYSVSRFSECEVAAKKLIGTIFSSNLMTATIFYVLFNCL